MKLISDMKYSARCNRSQKFEYNKMGNMISHINEQAQTTRFLAWTEDNRLQGFMETNNQSAYYNYDASGNRNFKFTGPTQNSVQNGTTYIQPNLNDQTLYASDLMTINKHGYTKHYFEEGKRICSKIGGGFTTNAPNDIMRHHVHSLVEDYDEQEQLQMDGVEKTFEIFIGVSPFVGVSNKLIYVIDAKIGQDDPEPAFFYHTDHLGSASYITNDTGRVTQTLNYLPYGEQWVDIKTLSAFISPYKFNGKEKDEETDYNYYGARYYDSENISWLSVDPLSDKYPSLSPYVYCANNPVNLVDPDRMQIDWVEDKNGKKYWNDNAKDQSTTKEGEKYLGEAVVVFNGSLDEKLGKNSNLFDDDAVLASVTVYGPKGANDIQTYQGYTMSSDPTKFGVMADGDYTVDYNSPGKGGKLPSHWAIENAGAVPALNGYNPAYPERDPGVLIGAYIHTSNRNGFAGTYDKGNGKVGGISEGCLLIVPTRHNSKGQRISKGWDDFNKQLKGVSKFRLELRRK
ncbi:MAG: RHS repeat-associated core domain-containing protein [Bacteroidales bacterium]|jgi:RHS repeat-associated protein|nr:RHS repeat-associated core domain-containing protein [Bacteroidales bacterium]